MKSTVKDFDQEEMWKSQSQEGKPIEVMGTLDWMTS
jgi:hypothetical protein